jgi:NADPH:quinone reductase-like Zn-dependent oxidoreductase
MTWRAISARPYPKEFEADARELRTLGASLVVEDEGPRGSANHSRFGRGNDDVKAALRALPQIVLALNSVGGQSSANLASLLHQDGTMVTYGGMVRPQVCMATLARY